ncbi:BTB/POZ domain-containing protein At3g22104-like [Abrus precatorius]|uniref:BTB/POZ domain-containing protein At3g22104-like n=1 Tax=Abrus precatorius TaxID=3816 RepID=A0A8B8K8Y2_ABRPR|nr:BTB/POZ domain-containing protein At3g22104-like [Abrus precatorius]
MEVTPSNVAMLCSAARFLEMECDNVLGTHSLKPHIEKFLEGIRFWTWSELLEALKQCQDLISSKSYLAILDRIVDHLIERLLISPGITSPYTCSSNRSSFQFSCDTSSNNSWRNNCSGATWWFEHLVFLKIDLLDKVIRTMISHDFDHGVVSRFLFYYHNSSCLGAIHAEKIETTKVVINLLSLLDLRSISCKDLFNLNRIAISLKISTCCINKIESLIGPLLDQATIDYLLLPSPHGRVHAYDVDFVLRLIHIFFIGGSFELTLNRLKRVAKMMDLFLVEVAPDPNLKPCELEALITVLTDNARESHDQLYLAIDMYLKVHAGLSEKEKMSICYTLNHEKLSAELFRHLTRNLTFPSEAKPRAHVTRQNRMKTLLSENDHLKTFFDSMFRKSFKNIEVKEDDEKGIYDADELRGNLEGMQGGTQLGSVKKSGIHIMSNALYLPKLCS